MARRKKDKVSKKAGTKRIRHKQYSYVTKAGVKVVVAAHFERVGNHRPKPMGKKEANS